MVWKEVRVTDHYLLLPENENFEDISLLHSKNYVKTFLFFLQNLGFRSDNFVTTIGELGFSVSSLFFVMDTFLYTFFMTKRIYVQKTDCIVVTKLCNFFDN